jgi:competence protein ComGC
MVIYNKQLQKRAGIAMIELIFALVIMGIVLMSAPMLIQQEAIIQSMLSTLISKGYRV